MTDCDVEIFHHMVNVEKYGEKFILWRNLSTLIHMRNVDTNQSCHNLRCFVAKYVLIKLTLFCRKICSVAVYALLRGEKSNQTLCLW